MSTAWLDVDNPRARGEEEPEVGLQLLATELEITLELLEAVVSSMASSTHNGAKLNLVGRS